MAIFKSHSLGSMSLRNMKLLIGRLAQCKNVNCTSKCNRTYVTRKRIVLGIESSCDDTACGIVDEDGSILGECVASQQEITTRYGGVMPPIARDLHEANIHNVVENALQYANLTLNEVDAIAVTNRPGLVMSLLVGINFAKEISKKFSKPLIPVHHMEAHALISRLFNKDVRYPFLTFLLSGGHCLLALVISLNEFKLLGHSIDDAPGEAYDKLARRLKLHNLSEYRSKSSGFAVEDAARRGNPLAFEFPQPLLKFRNCNFSFAGLKSEMMRIITKEEIKYNTEAADVLPNFADICASFQYAVATHLCIRLRRAMEFIERRELLPDNDRMLVISGGVARNQYFGQAFDIVGREMGYKLCIPPASYCSDNGVMIAWNGMERYLADLNVYYDQNKFKEIIAEDVCPLGVHLDTEVIQSYIKSKGISPEQLLQLSQQC